MNVLPSDPLVRVKELEAELFSGTFPGWVVDDSSGGTTTAYDAANDGGYWELDPGTGQPGDEARLETAFSLDPTAFDIVELETRVSVTTTDIDDLAFAVGLRMNGDASLLYSYLHPQDALADRLQIRSGSGEVNHDARTITDVSQHDLRLRWYSTAARVELYADHVLSAAADDVGLPTEGAYTPVWTATYRGGAGGALRVHSAAIRYYEQGNP